MQKEITHPQRKKLWEESLIYDRTLNGKELAKLWHPEGSFQIGSMPPVKGRENIEKFFSNFFSMGIFTTLEHEMNEVWDLPEVLIYNAVAVYTKPDGSVVRSPYVNIIKYKDGLFWDYRVFIDSKALLG